MFRVFQFCETCTRLWNGANMMSVRLASGDVPRSFRVAVLSNGGKGTSKSLAVIADRQSKFSKYADRFLINYSDSAQRNWQKLCTGFVKGHMDLHVLTTNNSCENTGGICMLATDYNWKNYPCHDGRTPLTVYSPPGLVDIFKHRTEIVRGMMNGHIRFTNSVQIDNTMCKVRNIVLKKSGDKKEYSPTDVYSYVFEMPAYDETNLRVHNNAVKQDGEDNRCDDVSEDHAVSDIQAGDRLRRDAILVIDCPSEDYLTSVIKNRQFQKYQRGGSVQACMVVHMSTSHILNSRRYRQFMKRFGEETQHLLLHEKCQTNVSPLVYNLNKVFSHLNKDIFPKLEKVPDPDLSPKVVNAANYMEFFYSPGNAHLRMNEEMQKYEWGDEKLESVPDLDAKLQYINKMSRIAKTDPRAYPQVIFLGTGGASITKNRNQPCIVVKVSEETSFIMDCGGGSYDQMAHFFNKDLETELAKVKMIFISHLHLDHHAGLQHVLKKCYEARKAHGMLTQPLYLMACRKLPAFYLQSVPEFYNLKEYYTFIDYFNPETFSPVLEALGLKFLSCDDVIHCPYSCGIVIKHEKGWSLAYTGDVYELTEAFIKSAKKCDLLIHEASYEDQMSRKRNINKHSCQSNAILNGQKIEAEFTVLSHLCRSSGGISTEILPRKSKFFTDKNFFAHDFTKINLTHRPILHLYNDLIYDIFGEKELIEKEKVLEKYNTRRKNFMFDYGV
ncbi:zinc phosphodiesterase ELAC protein 2-like [Ostrea edulis]|uniref:zinc phosphodiesterase ELAC protein 2-like n=1 Tax=Ostrea edulis TaxID=37623 RepID=UPI0024AE95E2|nr:zinc phosphodiesterase ELAC protein 2-like [Ostrea edulis]